MQIGRMRVKVSDAVGCRAKTRPVGRITLESRKALVDLLPALIDVAVVKMVAGIIGGDVRVHPDALAFDSRNRIRRNDVTESLVKKRVVNTGREAGVELVPEGPARHVIVQFSHGPKLSGIDIPKMIGVEDVVRDVFGCRSKFQPALLCGLGHA